MLTHRRPTSRWTLKNLQLACPACDGWCDSQRLSPYIGTYCEQCDGTGLDLFPETEFYNVFQVTDPLGRTIWKQLV